MAAVLAITVTVSDGGFSSPQFLLCFGLHSRCQCCGCPVLLFLSGLDLVQI